MGILVIYVGIIIAGDSVAFGIGEVIGHISPTFNLPILLAMFFAMFYSAGSSHCAPPSLPHKSDAAAPKAFRPTLASRPDEFCAAPRGH
jgi:hypothetical protein